MAQVTYRIEGSHGSIKNLEFANVPPFCVITGENGAGKTHLLEALAYGHNAPPDMSNAQRKSGPGISGLGAGSTTFMVRMWLEGQPYTTSNAFFASTTWAPYINSTATVEQIVADAHSLYSIPNAALDDQSFNGWWKNVSSVEQPDGMPPGWDVFLSALTPKRLFQGRQDLAYYFLSYQILKAACIEIAKKSGKDEAEAISHLGPSPWDLFNSFCKDANIDLEVIPPSIPQKASIFSRTPPAYNLKIRDTVRDKIIDIGEASTGEQIMISIVSWRFWATVANRKYDVIILDEPDAHLHPSLVRKFLTVLQTVLVEQHGARVIMSTHSPSTVSFAPPGSVFELRRHDEPRLIPVANTAEVVAKLCGGLVAVDPATRFVVLEGPTDLEFYRSLWILMTEAGLPAFPGVSFSFKEGCTKVQETIGFLREWDFDRFFGILDRDAGPNSNIESDGIYVLERNGVENYLFDPLNIWLCLWMYRKPVHAKLHQIPSLRQGAGAFLKSLPPVQLQHIVDSVWQEIRAQLSDVKPWMDERVPVQFYGGLELSYPRWFRDFDDHNLAAHIRSSFGKYPFPEKELQNSFMTLGLIPLDLWDIFNRITKLD